MKRSALRKTLAGVATGSLVLAANVQAAVPVEVDTALSDMKTDVAAVGAALVIAAGAVVGLKWMKGAIFG